MKFLLYFVLDLEAQVYLFYATEKEKICSRNLELSGFMSFSFY